MATFVALLQGINLGGKRRIAIPALRERMLALGLTDVVTYIQSGNIVFASHASSAGELATRIRESLRSDFGMEVPVIVRSSEEMQQIDAANSYGTGEDDPRCLHVTFLDHAPGDEFIARVNDVAFPPDVFRVRGQQIFVRHANGVTESSIDFAWIARTLEIGHMTSRNWRTVKTLAGMARDRS